MEDIKTWHTCETCGSMLEDDPAAKRVKSKYVVNYKKLIEIEAGSVTVDAVSQEDAEIVAYNLLHNKDAKWILDFVDVE